MSNYNDRSFPTHHELTVNAATLIKKCQASFFEKGSSLKFAQEQLFAVTAFQNNEYLAKVAYQNPDSLRSAMLMVASVGLSLNPANRHAYLVPRKGRVCADFGYLGLIELGIRGGKIASVVPDLVYENDEFRSMGKRQMPHHQYDPFDSPEKRGALRGVYSSVTLNDGSCLIEFMNLDQIHKVRDKSEAWKAFSDPSNTYVTSCVWDPITGWYEEMVLKTVIKKHYKLWPGVSTQMNEAISHLNNELGEGIVIDVPPTGDGSMMAATQVNDCHELVDKAISIAAQHQNAFHASREWLEGMTADSHEAQAFALNKYDARVAAFKNDPNQLLVSAQ